MGQGWIGLAGIGLAATAASALVAACATDGERGGNGVVGQREARQCFLPRQVSGFSPEGRDTVYVNVGPRRVYRLELAGPCPDVDWSQRIAIRRTGGSSWVCAGLDAELLVPSPIGPQRCPVTRVTQLTDEEVTAWRQRGRSRR